MDKLLYTDFIKIYQNEDTIRLIGKIDIDFLRSECLESLFYIFPLVERIILEIYKMNPESDVEVYEQGTMRTINSVIEFNKNLNVLPKYIEKIIEKYYGDNGIRNELFHITEEIIELKINFKELEFLIMKLMLILKNRIKNCTNVELKYISYIL